MQTVDGYDMAAILKAFNRAKKAKSGKPQLIIAHTIIAKGIPEVQGTQKGHGEGGAKFADSARAGLGLPADKHFYVSDEVKAYFAGRARAPRSRLRPLAEGLQGLAGGESGEGRAARFRIAPSRARPTS